jgi:hypothetical protein
LGLFIRIWVVKCEKGLLVGLQIDAKMQFQAIATLNSLHSIRFNLFVVQLLASALNSPPYANPIVILELFFLSERGRTLVKYSRIFMRVIARGRQSGEPAVRQKWKKVLEEGRVEY